MSPKELFMENKSAMLHQLPGLMPLTLPMALEGGLTRVAGYLEGGLTRVPGYQTTKH